MVRRLRSLPLAARYAALPVRISPDHAGINRDPSSPTSPSAMAALYGRLEQLSQQIALAETTVPVLREGQTVRHHSVEPQPDEAARTGTEEPAVCKMAGRLGSARRCQKF
jgi:hypothetical protein